MRSVRKDFVLQGQKRPARIDEIQAGQIILFGDLLGAQMLLDRHWEIRPAFDSSIVGDDHYFTVANAPDAGDDSRAGSFVIIEVSGSEGRELKERRTGV